MTRETDTLLDDGFRDDSSEKPEAFEPVNGEQSGLHLPGELEFQHHALLVRQGQDSDVEELVNDARAFVARARGVGATVEDPRLRQHCQSILDYWSIFAYRAAQVEVDADLLPFDPSLAPSLEDEQFPYRFEEEMGNYAQRMLGWRRLLDECERDLAGNHLLTVMGEVGAGVRFLIHKLVVPALRSGRARLKEFTGSDKWRYYELPLDKEPVADLIRAIARQEGHDAQWVAQRTNEFRRDKATLSRILESDAARPAVLVLHRFGSLLKASRNERAAITDNLARLLQDPQQRYYVITALRRDQTIALPKFGALEKPLRAGHVRMAFTMAELRHLIEEPARCVGLIFEPGLIDKILIDIQGESTALPLLRFTLARLWNRRERNRITWDAYKQIGAGRTALSNAMDDVYAELSQEQQETLRNILLAMVNLEPNGSFSTCQVSREDLDRMCGDKPHVDEVLERLQRQDLVRKVPEAEPVTFFVTCNALLISWPPLINWLDELRVKERFRLRLRQAATLWNERGKPKDLLWQGAMLVEAKEEFNQDSSLTTTEQNFLRSSGQREDDRRLKRRVVAGGIAFAAILTVSALLFAFVQHERKKSAVAAMALAEIQLINARIDAELDRQNAESAEREARTNAQQRQRMFGETMEGLRSGDLPGAMLWLDARRRVSELDLVSEPKNEEIIRRLAGLQIPELDVLGTVADHPKEAFEHIALSPNQQHLAVIEKREVEGSAGHKKSYTVKISSLAHLPNTLQLLTPSPLEGTAISRGSLAFINPKSDLSAPMSEYLLVGADQLYVWKRDGEEWIPFGVKPLPGSDAPIVSLAVGGDSLLLTIHQEQSPRLRRLRLWKVSLEPDPGGLILTEMPSLGELEKKSVQVASLSSQGHLLVVCGEEPSEATELMAWFKNRDEDSWELTSPPEWVHRLAKEDEQRLYDWGWTLTGHETSGQRNWKRTNSWIRAASFSPRGDQFVTACDDGQVLIWSLPKMERELEEKETRATDNGTTTARLFITPKFETHRTLGSSVIDVAFVTNDVVITGGRDRTVRVWDIHAGAEVAPRLYHEGTVVHVKFGKSGMLVTNTSHILRIWRSEEYAKIASTMTVQHVARSTDKGRFVFATNQESEPMRERLPLAIDAQVLEETRIRSTVISPDGNWVFTASRDGEEGAISMNVRPWEQLDQEFPLESPESLNGIPLAAFSNSGDWLAVAEKSRNASSPRIFLWNVKAGSSAEGKPQGLSLPPEAASRSTLTFEKMAFGRLGDEDFLVVVGKEDLDSDELPRGIIFLGVRKRDDDHSTWMLRPLNIHPAEDSTSSFPHNEEVLCLAFSGDGKVLATGDAHDRVKLWNVEKLIATARQSLDHMISAQPTAELKHSSDVDNLAFGPGGASRKILLATVSSDGEAAVWSITAGSANKDPDFRLQHDAKILTASFSPDGKWIITGGADRTARIWDSRDGQLVGIFRHQGPVVQAWMPRDDQILTVSRSLLIGASGQEPPFHVRHWRIPASGTEQTREFFLEKLAARQVDSNNMRLEPLQAGKYAPER